VRSWGLAAALLSVACTEPRTEVVVVVSARGLDVPRQIDSLQIAVTNRALTGEVVTFFDSQALPLCEPGESGGCYGFPITLTLVPGSERSGDPVRVQVNARLGTSQIISDAAIFTFRRGVSARLDFILSPACLDKHCAESDRACDEKGECVVLSPIPFDGEPLLDLGLSDDSSAPNDQSPLGDLSAPPDLTPRGVNFAAGRSYSTGIFPIGIIATDLNGDGRTDVATLSEVNAEVHVLLANTSGDLVLQTPVPIPAVGTAIAAANLNGGGRPDLVVSNGNQVSVLLNNGDGTFAGASNYATAGTGPTAVAIDDMDGDGALDVVTSDKGSDQISVLKNNGAGILGTAAGHAAGTRPHHLVVGQIDGVGRKDVVVSNEFTSTVTLLTANGSGGYDAPVPFTVSANPGHLAIGDVDGDVDLDLVVGYFGTGDLTVLKNNGSGALSSQTGPVIGANSGIALLDLNGDGRPEAIGGNASTIGSGSNSGRAAPQAGWRSGRGRPAARSAT
jgi:hypothetical protein